MKMKRAQSINEIKLKASHKKGKRQLDLKITIENKR